MQRGKVSYFKERARGCGVKWNGCLHKCSLGKPQAYLDVEELSQWGIHTIKWRLKLGYQGRNRKGGYKCMDCWNPNYNLHKVFLYCVDFYNLIFAYNRNASFLSGLLFLKHNAFKIFFRWILVTKGSKIISSFKPNLFQSCFRIILHSVMFLCLSFIKPFNVPKRMLLKK